MESTKVIDGVEIVCDSSLPYIGFKADWMETEDGWFFQEHEASNVIDEINEYADRNDISFWDAAVWWCNLYLY